MKVQFDEIILKGIRKWRDPITGKIRQETKKFSQTINPWNKAADGSPKTRKQILAELEIRRAEWVHALLPSSKPKI